MQSSEFSALLVNIGPQCACKDDLNKKELCPIHYRIQLAIEADRRNVVQLIQDMLNEPSLCKDYGLPLPGTESNARFSKYIGYCIE